MTKQNSVDQVLMDGALGENASRSQTAQPAAEPAVERRSPPRTVARAGGRVSAEPIKRLPQEVAARYPLSAEFRATRPEKAAEEDARTASFGRPPADIENDAGRQRITRQVGKLPVHMTVEFEVTPTLYADGSVASVEFSAETAEDIRRHVKTAVLSYFDLWKIVMTTASRDRVGAMVDEILADPGNYYMTERKHLAKYTVAKGGKRS